MKYSFNAPKAQAQHTKEEEERTKSLNGNVITDRPNEQHSALLLESNIRRCSIGNIMMLHRCEPAAVYINIYVFLNRAQTFRSIWSMSDWLTTFNRFNHWECCQLHFAYRVLLMADPRRLSSADGGNDDEHCDSAASSFSQSAALLTWFNDDSMVAVAAGSATEQQLRLLSASKWENSLVVIGWRLHTVLRSRINFLPFGWPWPAAEPPPLAIPCWW